MKNRLEDFIYQRVKEPKEADVQEILSIFYDKKYDKGGQFKERNTVIKELGFLTRGSARSYVINKSGDEITGQITTENHFLSEIISVRSNQKTSVIIEFLEASQVVAAPMNLVIDLLQKNLVFNILIREYMGDRAAEAARILILFTTGTAKERYEYIMKTNPHLLQKFPLRYIASMIGVTPTQLSRIRSLKS